ncbi:MAG: hypothetical protein JNN32_12505 [Flavobacteriales bacterium]|nr:hypothetical protein [Flavobacteriales bacterium]
MTRLFRWILIMVGALGLAALVVALSFPFLAVNEPSGARTAVVEGWIDPVYMPDVNAMLREGGYERIYITGTPRNFSYTLRFGDTVVVELQRPMRGSLVVNACGGKDTELQILSGSTMILRDSLTDTCHDRTRLLEGPVQELRFTPVHAGVPEKHWELLFLLYARIDGVNLHALQRRVTIHRSDGSRVPGTPSFADATAEALIAAGTPRHIITRLPTVMLGESRTWANAQRFAREARTTGIDKVDIISFGIHARRSRIAYHTACGKGVTVGIRCVEDPELQRGRWWRSSIGWLKVLRELAGVPTSYLVKPVD